MFSFLLNHWDGYFLSRPMNQGSQVIPGLLLANFYMALTVGQLCSSVFTWVVPLSPHDCPMGYVLQIISILQIGKVRPGEVKETAESSSFPPVLSEGPKTLTMGTSDQSYLHNNTQMLYVIFHCVDVMLGIKTTEGKTAGTLAWMPAVPPTFISSHRSHCQVLSVKNNFSFT